MLILGGTGRVGASTASALLRKCPDTDIILASRSTKSYEAAVKKRPELAKSNVMSFLAYQMLVSFSTNDQVIMITDSAAC